MSTASSEQLKADLRTALEAGDVELANAIDRKLKAAQQPQGAGSGLADVAANLPRHMREVGAAAAMGPAKMLTGLIDLTTAGKQAAGMPNAGQLPYLTPYIDSLRDKLAGRPLGNETPTAVAEAAFSGPAGMLVSGTTNEAINQGVPAPLAMAAGIASPYALKGAKEVVRSNFNPLKPVGERLTEMRFNEALAGTNLDQLPAMSRQQGEAAKRGVHLFPSQLTSQGSPGFQQLETEILRSKAPQAAGVQQLAFKQAPATEAMLRQTLSRYLPTKANQSTEEAAANLQKAATDRLTASANADKGAVAPVWNQAKATPARIGYDDVEDMLQKLRGHSQDMTLPQQARGPLKEMEKFLGGKVADVRAAEMQVQILSNSLKKATAKQKPTVEAALRKAEADLQKAKDAVQVHPAEVRARYQDIEHKLSERDAGGNPTYSDKAAGDIRKALDAVYRDQYEYTEPMYRVARELTRSRKENFARTEFDPVEVLSQGQGDPRKYLSSILQRGDGLPQVARGQSVRQPTGQRQVEGANPEAVRDALAKALDLRRQDAFRLSDTGEMLQHSPAKFVEGIAATAEQKKALANTLRSVGVNPKPLMDDLGVVEAAGRPTVVHGSRVPGTEVNPVDLARATIGGTLQAQQARMTIVRSLINRLSDAEVAKVLENPRSLDIIKQIPQKQALRMTQRDLAVAVLAASGQFQPTE